LGKRPWKYLEFHVAVGAADAARRGFLELQGQAAGSGAATLVLAHQPTLNVDVTAG